jgi:glycosidase
MHPNFTEFCTESQRRNPSSIWMSYRDMIRLRKQHKALASYPSMWASLSRDWPCWQVYGSYELIDPDHLSVFAYTRTDEHETYLVVLSFAEERVEWDVPVAQRGEWQIVISNFGRVSTLQELGDKLELGTFDGIIWRRGIMWTGACQ